MKLSINLLFALLVAVAFTSCKGDKAADAVVGEAKEVAKSMTGTSYSVDGTTSLINWTGSKPTGSHTGNIKVSEGSLTVKDGNLTAGDFTIDMNSINCTDLEGDKKEGLEAHLTGKRSPDEADDFFNVDKYPTAAFKITKVTKLVNDPAATHLVYGNLTLKSVTKEVGIKAKVNVTDNMITVTTPEFAIDRTDWGIKFMSKNFMDSIKDGFINDEIKLAINLKAKA